MSYSVLTHTVLACKNGGLVSCSLSTGMILTSIGSVFLIVVLFLFVYIGVMWVTEDDRRSRYMTSFLAPSDYDGCC